MSDRTGNHRELYEQIHQLVTARINDEMTPEQFTRLDTLLSDSAAARRLYVQYIYETLALPSLLGTVDSLDLPPLPLEEGVSKGCMAKDESLADSELFAPQVVLNLSPSDRYPLSANRSFVDGPVFSYMAATVILGVMLLSAWAYKITHFQQTPFPQIANSPSVPSVEKSELVFVGRITGMKECKWSDPQTEAYGGAFVPLGRKYALSSGLMEITYKSGAKVIIEGPCTYEVDSRTGGYLSLGKLTARIEKRREKREERVQPQSVSLSLLFPLPSPLFSVRTPTAIITDLGTEFGVEVSPGGNTVSFVFRGSVKVEVVGDDQNQEVVLREKESAYVEKGDSGTRLVLDRKVADSPKFVRRIIALPKLLDILDIVAGGRGTGNRRERGIDPSTGKSDPLFLPTQHKYEHRYHSVAWHKLIDGVFIPDGIEKPVKLDSAGHMFDDFGPLTEGLAVGSIWARAANISSFDQESSRWRWVYSMGRGDKFMPKGRGLLALHSNSGITFDLQAMREMYQGVCPSRFRATTGIADATPAYPEPFGKADVWVFVDGRMKWTRKLHHQKGVVGINVELGPEDRFLTLMSTNAGNGASCDWVVLGDPVLEMTSTETKDHEEDLPMEE